MATSGTYVLTITCDLCGHDEVVLADSKVDALRKAFGPWRTVQRWHYLGGFDICPQCADTMQVPLGENRERPMSSEDVLSRAEAAGVKLVTPTPQPYPTAR